MKLKTIVAPAPAGCALIRDVRAWHVRASCPRSNLSTLLCQ